MSKNQCSTSPPPVSFPLPYTVYLHKYLLLEPRPAPETAVLVCSLVFPSAQRVCSLCNLCRDVRSVALACMHGIKYSGDRQALPSWKYLAFFSKHITRPVSAGALGEIMQHVQFSPQFLFPLSCNSTKMKYLQEQSMWAVIIVA